MASADRIAISGILEGVTSVTAGICPQCGSGREPVVHEVIDPPSQKFLCAECHYTFSSWSIGWKPQ